MNNPLIQHRCICGYHLVSNPDAEKKWTLTHKGFAHIFHPCSKCLESQAEEMVETIEKIIRDMNASLESDEIYALEESIVIIYDGGIISYPAIHDSV